MSLHTRVLNGLERLLEIGCESIGSRVQSTTFYTEGDPYLKRCYLLRRSWFLPVDDDKDTEEGLDLKWWQHFIPGIYLHYFYRGDMDEALHNHPWETSASLILTNGYVEERWDGVSETVSRRMVKPGDINIIRANDYHRVTLIDPRKGAWTLFFAGSRVQDWSFGGPDYETPIPWREFVDKRDGNVRNSES